MFTWMAEKEGGVMGTQKFRVTQMEVNAFYTDYMQVGKIVYVNWDEERVYSEDMKQYMPLDLALKFGLEGEQVE